MKRCKFPDARLRNIVCTFAFVLISNVQSQRGDISCKLKDVKYPGIQRSVVVSHIGQVFALFKCVDSDKEIRGIGYKQCIGNTWQPQGLSPRCAPMSDCERLPAIQNGAYDGSYPYRHGVTIHMTCNRGYKMVGPSSSTRCILRGWSKELGTCKKICHLPQIKAPLDTLSKGDVVEGDRVRFLCRGADQGLEGLTKLKCLSNGSLSGTLPTCKQRSCKACWSSSDCRDKMLRPLTESGVQFKPAKGRYYMNEEVQAECTTGYHLNPGSARVYKCLPKVPANDGRLQFRKIGEELEAVCERYGCRRPQGQNMTSLIESEHQKKKFIFDPDEVVKFTCGPHQLVGSMTSRCQRHTWAWSKEWPTCKVRSCDAPSIDGAELTFSDESRQTGSTVAVECDTCRQAFGFQQSTCKSNGTLTDWMPSLEQTRCQVVRCPAIKMPPNDSTAPLFNAERWPVCGTVVRFSCPEGLTLLGPKTIYCQRDGQWSDCPPICVRQECGTQRVCKGGQHCVQSRNLGSEPSYKCVCLPPSVCPTCPYQQQVCGSNGKTYSSECHLKVSSCHHDRQWYAVGKRGQACRHDGICFLPMPSSRPGTRCIGGVLRWYFDFTRGQCIAYKHSKCFEGLNSFESRSACRQRCIRADMCSKPQSLGACNLPVQRYSFNSKLSLCRSFSYRGCYGNDNNFPDQRTCQAFCVTKEMQRKDPCFSKECPHVNISTACQRHDKPVFAMVADIQERTQKTTYGNWTGIHVLAKQVFSLHKRHDLPSFLMLLRRGASECDCPDLPAGKFLIIGIVESTVERMVFVIDESSFVHELPRDNAARSMLQQHCPGLVNQ